MKVRFTMPDGTVVEKDIPGIPGKSAYEYAKDGGYTGTPEEFAAKLAREPLVGTTAELTPSDVQIALSAGRPVSIEHSDDTYGEMTFGYTSHAALIGNQVVSSIIFEIDEATFAAQLFGDLQTNAWSFQATILAKSTDIPTVTSQLANDSGFLTAAPVTSVNGQTGDVSITVPVVPTALPNPCALTIGGKTYNGSKAVSVTVDDIPDYVRTEAERLTKVVQSRKNANTVTFIACSDLHHSYEISTAAQQDASLLHLGQAMSVVREQVQIDFAAMLGDTVWDHGESVDNALKSMRYVNSCLHTGFNGIPNFRTRGNHECLYNGDGLSDTQIFANIFAFNSGANYDPDNRLGGYCYRDFEDYKLRVVCVNTCESSDGSFAVSDTQNTWLQSALDLSDKGTGWRSIVLGHHPPDWASSNSNLVQSLKAASGLIAVFHGHVHGFKVDKIPGTEITRIAIPNACFGRENEYGQNGATENAEGTEFGEETTYGKTTNSANDTAFCVVTIDLAEKKIYADHYGAGYSRVVPFDDVVLNSYTVIQNLTNVTSNNATASVTDGASYTATLTATSGYALESVTITMGGTDITATAYNGGVISIASVTGDIVITATAVEITTDSGNYTNLLPTAQAIDSTEPYNGTGYKDGYRMSSTSPFESVADGYVLTGYIPYAMEADTLPGTIYIKGAAWDEVSNCRLYFFSDKSTMCGPAIQGGKGDNGALSASYTLETLGDSYFRLAPVDAGGGKWAAQNIAATVTNMEFFRISLAGSGAGLIITVDEPIE